MSKVVVDLSMSLDGFITASDMTPEEPLGAGGERLHEWAFGRDDGDRRVMAEGASTTRAIIAGRRTYDDSVKWWGADGPSGSARVPVFVLSHDEPADVPANGVYRFVSGIERALAEARATAGDATICIMGGAETAQQCISAGAVDELSLHLVPVLFGGGIRLFEQLGAEHIQLENLEATQTAAATHLRFRVVR